MERSGTMRGGPIVKKMETSRRLTFLLHAMLVILLVGVGLPSPYAYAQLDEVNTLVQAGRYTEANNKLESLAKSAKDIAVKSLCYYQIGEIHYNYTHQYARAAAAYDKIIKLEKKGIAPVELYLAIIKKGDVYSRMGNYRDATETYNRLVKLAPDSHFAHKTGLQKIRDIDTALADLREQQRIAIQYKGTPLAIVAEFQIAELYRNPSQLNQPEKAIQKYEALLKAHPEATVAPEARWRIANLRHAVLNQSALAMATYRKVVDDYPTSNFAAEALFQMANIHRTTEKYSLAIPVFERLKHGYPNFWNMHAVFYWMGVCYEKNLHYPKAIAAFKTFRHVYLPHLDPEYLGQISMHDMSLSDVKTKIGKRIEKLTQQLSEVEAERLDTARSEQNFALALDIARNLVTAAPNTPQAKQAAEQITTLQHLAAIQNLREQLHNETSGPVEAARALFQIGTIYERQLRDYPKAVEAYQEVSEYHPDSTYSAEALYRSGLIHAKRLSVPNEAIETYKQVIAAHPNTLQAMMANFQLGELYRELHRYNEALQAYESTIGYPERDRYLAGGYKDSFADRAQFRIGRVHYDDNRYDEARFVFQTFLQNRERSPRRAAAYIYLAAISEERAENSQAIEYYKKAETLLKDDPVQMRMFIEEASTLGTLQSTDPDAAIRYLKEKQKRLSTQ
ncbi:tetratricopeptide repeat protein [Candidatus Poribacteria bacterium]|nr:tetratricopeptide repeat protein [Candidatus Poribacteria bacterium]MYK95629.1 tetratricopeptide repeat protein [Candidatus Poribacteria bacterium]